MYKLGLIRSLIDRAYKINSTWLGFHQETTKIRDFLLKNSYPAHIINKAINSTIKKSFQFNRQNGNNSPECSYVKLPYVGKFSAIAQERIRRTIQRFCDNSFNIKLVFSSFKIGSLFSGKTLSLKSSNHALFIDLVVQAAVPAMLPAMLARLPDTFERA